MRLFFQLTDEEQNDVLNHCVGTVVEDMIEEGVNLEPITDDDEKIKDILSDAISEAKKINDKKEQLEFLLSNDTVARAIYDIALDMAKNAFYHEEEELVIFPAALKEEKTKEEKAHADTFNTLPAKKTTYSLN